MLADVSGILTLRKVINHGNPRWRISAQINGKRTQRFFNTKAEAQTWLTELRRKSPVEQFWHSLPTIEQQRIMLKYQTGALDLFSQKEIPNYITLSDAVCRYVDAKKWQDLRTSSFKQIKRYLQQLCINFKGKQCHEISTSMIEIWFRKCGWKRSTIDGVLAKIGLFFNWCVREKYISANPTKGVMRPRRDESEPCIFSPYEVARLLSVSCYKDPKLLPYLTLGLFAGVRPEETMRLNWNNITEHGINISGHKAKTRQRRFVTIADNLAAWLKLRGNLPPQNRQKRLEAIRRTADVTWGHDIMRHTFASYHLAYHGSPDRTAHELGHRDTNMLFRHYRQLVTKEDAEKFWAICP